MPSPFGTPIRFDALEGFKPIIRPLADGIRASTAAECASCAIIEYLNPEDERLYSGFNPGVATLGHLLHQAWAWQAFARERVTDYLSGGEFVSGVEVEAAIPWAHGVSHDDVVVYGGPHAGVYEVKTHSDTKPKNPSAANHRQSQFRMRLRELAGLTQPGPMMLVMIGKAGNESGWVRGPFTVELTDDRRAEIDATLAGIDAVMANVESLDLHGPELRALANGCTKCFPKPKVQPVAGLDGLLGRYVSIDREYQELDQQRKDYAAAVKSLKAEREQLREQIKPLVPDGAVVEGMAANATVTRSGALTITYDKPDTASAA